MQLKDKVALITGAASGIGKEMAIEYAKQGAKVVIADLALEAASKTAKQIAAVRDQLIATKKRILAFDDTTFYSKLASGESLMAHAWDGWCNYGTQANAAIKFVVPKEGSDLWVDTMVVLKSSKHQEEAFKFVNFMLAKENHAWVAENILYKVPNQAAMAGLSADLLKQYPNLTIAPSELLKMEQLRDLGGTTQKAYTRAVTEIMAAQN